MIASVNAGGVVGANDPLYPLWPDQPKALLPLAGRPMVEWVLEALEASRVISGLVIVGLPAEVRLAGAGTYQRLPDHGSLIENTLAGLAWIRSHHPQESYALVASADLPALTAEVVDWRVDIASRSQPFDIDYVAATREVMEAMFPGASRSYLRLRDVELCGGDVNVISLEAGARNPLWDRLVEARKSVLRQAAVLGLNTLLLLLLRQLTAQQLAQRASRRLGITANLHLAPFAEVAMDVDRPNQVELMERYLSRTSKS